MPSPEGFAWNFSDLNYYHFTCNNHWKTDLSEVGLDNEITE